MPPNLEQQRLAELPVGNVLVVAPAGCGKTEALAARAQAVLARSDVVAPRTVLALTFSIKARENLARRMRKVVGAGWRRRIVVRNLHGLAARVMQAHGEVVGLSRDLIYPEDRWRSAARRDLGITYKNGDAFDGALSYAKAGRFDDDEVIDRLHETGHRAAIEYEERLRAEGRIDYDDMLRHAARVLAVPEVARLYQTHFGMTLVDEVQDLSLLQFEMVRAVGGNKVTYAGDPAQGIYSFAGAAPEEVLALIEALDGLEVVRFNQSYRSSPAVLRAVNALAREIGATELECADPSAFRSEGRVVSLERENKEDEAAALIAIVEKLTADPSVTVGVVGRRGGRATELRAAAQVAGVTFEDWTVPTHVPAVVEVLNRCVAMTTSHELGAAEELVHLEQLCREAIESTDVELLDELASAIDSLAALVADGMTVAEAVGTCRPSPQPGNPVAAGMHVLTGHKGKGQEFDWVVVVGLETGHVPDFRSVTEAALREELRILHVMASRAKYGLVFTYARTEGRWKRDPSPWLELLRSEATHTNHR